MPLILRAIITGFGYKLGAELGRYVATRVGLIEGDKAKDDAKEDVPDGITTVPSEPEVPESDGPESDGPEDAEPDAG